MEYKAVIFDLDGTLVNSLNDLADSVNVVLKEYGYPTHPVDKYRIMVGNGIGKLIERALPANVSGKIREEVLARFKTVYESHQLDKTAPYEGIINMLEDLKKKNIPLAVCTNKHDEAAKKIIATLFARNTFQEIIGDLPGFKRKPDPQKVFIIAENMALKPQEIVYIGDSSVDMQTAVNAGMLPVGVLWGFRAREELVANGAALLLEHPSDLFRKVIFVEK